MRNSRKILPLLALAAAFGAEVRGSHPGYELAQASPVVRGEKIQPLSPGPVLTNAPVVSANTNTAGLTNQPVAFKDGSYFGFERLTGYSIRLVEHLEYATNAPLADAEVNAMIPAAIRAMEGRTILVNGYMTPLHYEAGKTRLFILSRNPSGCCFGDMPQIHEMIEVRMKGAPAFTYSYLPVQVRGVLRVGVKRNGDALASIYRLEAETVDEAAE